MPPRSTLRALAKVIEVDRHVLEQAWVDATRARVRARRAAGL
jgi:hypothetical protein